ncbi:MAG: SIS domain-containing protein [Bacteroidales bacterium]|nr:SIS domain-containing protein [Bacteroidales bacterium]MBN2820088.1 SIS domain-containing protein [Bacteroidales bacterium]
MNIQDHFSDYFSRLKNTIDKVNIGQLEEAVEILLKVREEEKTTYIFGNGGSAANASHIAGDFLKGISYGLDKRFRVHCLNDNMAATTAITNDLTYSDVFVEQLMTFLKPGDVVIGISGSGNSDNVLKAVEWAGKNGAHTIGVIGYKGGKLINMVDTAIHIPVDDMEITEDLHIIVFHAIKQYILKKIKGDKIVMGEAYEQRVKQ